MCAVYELLNLRWKNIYKVTTEFPWRLRDIRKKSVIIINHHHHQSVLPKGRSFTASVGCTSAEGRSSSTSSGNWLQFTRDWTGEVVSRCFPHLILSLVSEQTLKDQKRSQGHQRGVERNLLTGPSGLHRNSSQGLNISSIRVFDQIRDPEILITLRTLWINNIQIFLIYSTKVVKEF